MVPSLPISDGHSAGVQGVLHHAGHPGAYSCHSPTCYVRLSCEGEHPLTGGAGAGARVIRSRGRSREQS
eukprot:2978499-Rhodomonas_salina.1